MTTITFTQTKSVTEITMFILQQIILNNEPRM